VQHNPGILEVYQTNTEYHSVSGASDYMKDLGSAASLAETTQVAEKGTALPRAIPLHVAGGDESVAYETPQYLIQHVGPTERFFTFSIRFDRYVLQLSVQGGAGLNTSAALGVLNAAGMSLLRSCSLAPATIHAVS
jgi:hypothetical protein